MILTDDEIVKKLKIKSTDKILDIGGSMMQHAKIKVDTIVDIIKPEDSPYSTSKLLAKHFIELDVTRKKLPFKDKEFDVCLCTHTLEDLPTPFPVIEEMQRVAKRGLIVTPSMGEDMVFSQINYTDWLTGARRVPGLGHHKWFFLNEKGLLKIIPKNYSVLYTPEFQVVGWTGEKEMVFFWKDKFDYQEFPDLNIHSLIDEYKKFLTKNKNLIKLGTVAVFIDNPINLLRGLAKRLLKRGKGYLYRKNTHSF